MFLNFAYSSSPLVGTRYTEDSAILENVWKRFDVQTGLPQVCRHHGLGIQRKHSSVEEEFYCFLAKDS